MAWKKNEPEAIRRFDELAAVPGATRKMMFGCPVYELGGKRYALLHGSRVVLALSPEHTAKLIERGGRPREPMEGRRSKDKGSSERFSTCSLRKRYPLQLDCDVGSLMLWPGAMRAAG